MDRTPYGRPPDPTRRWLWPVAALLAGVLAWFGWLLLALTAASVPLWLRALGWRLPLPIALAGGLIAAGSWPSQQAWALEQLTALVAALLAGAAYCLARGGEAVGSRQW